MVSGDALEHLDRALAFEFLLRNILADGACPLPHEIVPYFDSVDVDLVLGVFWFFLLTSRFMTDFTYKGT